MAFSRGGVNRFGSMKQFAGHRQGSSGGEFLRKWKDKGVFDAWYHCQVMPIAIWIHKIPKLVPVKNRQTNTTVTHVWSDSCVCYESEATLEGQYFRDKETGERKHPPKRCGLCKLVEWFYQQCVLFESYREENEAAIAANKPQKVKGIRFTTPIFDFHADVAEERMVMHAGGIANLLGKDLDDEQKADIAKAKIMISGPKGAFRENAYAKCNYIMCVVNNDRPDDGVQIAVETSSLGDAVKKVINDIYEDEERDLAEDPFIIRWKFHKNAPPNEMYDALAMRKIKPSPRVLKLIRSDITSQTSESIDRITQRFNQKEVRSMLEKYCAPEYRKVIPWDDLFPTEAQEKQWAKDDAEEAAAAEKLAEEQDANDAQRGGGDDDEERSTKRASREPGDDEEEDDEQAETDEDGDEVFECDNEDCKAPVKATDTECAKCGLKYEVADDKSAPPPPPPPKSLPSRKEMLAKKAAAKAEKPAKSEEGDEIPFG